MIEAKASILTTTAKYGFDPLALKRELLRKAITGDEGERKGAAQLHCNLHRWLQGDDIIGIDRRCCYSWTAHSPRHTYMTYTTKTSTAEPSSENHDER